MKPENFADFAAAVFAAPIMQAAKPTAAQTMADKVDELGALRSVIADLQAQADKIRTELEDAGLSDIEGNLYRVNFATVAGSTLTNWRAVAERLKASPQLIRAYTKTGEASTRMTVKARQTH